MLVVAQTVTCSGCGWTAAHACCAARFGVRRSAFTSRSVTMPAKAVAANLIYILDS